VLGVVSSVSEGGGNGGMMRRGGRMGGPGGPGSSIRLASRLRYARGTKRRCSGSGDQQLSLSQQPITTVTKPISSASTMYTSALPDNKH